MKFKLTDRFLVTCKVSAKVYKTNNRGMKRILWKPKYDIDIDDSIFADTDSETWLLVEDNIKHCSHYLEGEDTLAFDEESSIITLTHEFNCHRYDIHRIFDMDCNFDFNDDFKYWLKSYMEFNENDKICRYGESVELTVETFDVSFDIELHPNLDSYYGSVDKQEADKWDREIAAEKIQRFYRTHKFNKSL